MFVRWAIYNGYILIKATFIQQAKGLSFRNFLDQCFLNLVGAFQPAAVRRQSINADALKCLKNVGSNLPKIRQDGFTNNLCAMSSYKYNNFKQNNATMAFKDYSAKAVNFSGRCTTCQRFLCIKSAG